MIRYIETEWELIFLKKLHSMGIVLILVPSFIRITTCIYFLGLQGLKVVMVSRNIKTCIFH